MKDQTTGLPVRISPDTTGAYIRLPLTQVDTVKSVLDSRHIPYSVKETVVSLSGGPFMAVVYLGREADMQVVQAILDNVG